MSDNKELKDSDLKKVSGGDGIEPTVGLICPICSNKIVLNLYSYSRLKADDMIQCPKSSGETHSAPKKDWALVGSN